VLELLAADGEADRLRESLVGRAVAQGALDVPLATGEEARAQLAVRGDADPVARGAERLRDRVHEAELALPVRERESLRGRGGLRRQLEERPVLGLDERTDLGPGQHL